MSTKLSDAQLIISEINNSVSHATKRQHGLLKMSLFLENCSTNQEHQLFEQNCLFWLKTLFQILENHPVSLHAKLAHYCFYLIVQNSKNVSNELSRAISTNYIEKSVQICLSSSDTMLKNALICLNELMLCYRPSCSQFKQKIETFVYHKLDSDSNEVIEWASICYSKLAFLQKNTNPMQMWSIYFKNMLNGANNILNELFDEYQPAVQLDLSHTDNSSANQPSTSSFASTSLQSSCNKSDKLFSKLVKDTDNLEVYFKRSANRFKACCVCLTYMFEPLYEKVHVKVKLADVIQLLKRIFTLDVTKLLNNSRTYVESKLLCDILSDLLNEVLKFSLKFFKIAGTNLLTSANEISQFLAGFTNNLNEKVFFNSTCLYFDCVTEWMKTNGPSSGFYKYSANLIESVLIQIKPTQKKLLLIETKSDQQKKLSNKTSQETALDGNFIFDEKSIINQYQINSRNKMIVSMFNFLKTYIRIFNYKLAANLLDKIQTTIVDVLLLVQYNSSSRKPYDQIECRICLFETLLQLCSTQNSSIPAPLSQAVHIFRSALDDDSNQIKQFAQQSLVMLKLFTQPVLPLIHYKEYSLEQQQQPENREETSAANNLNELNEFSKSVLSLTHNTVMNQANNGLYNQANFEYSNQNQNYSIKIQNNNFEATNNYPNENMNYSNKTISNQKIQEANDPKNTNWLKRKNVDNSMETNNITDGSQLNGGQTVNKCLKLDNNGINKGKNKNGAINQEDSNGNEFDEEDEDECEDDDDEDCDIIEDDSEEDLEENEVDEDEDNDDYEDVDDEEIEEEEEDEDDEDESSDKIKMELDNTDNIEDVQTVNGEKKAQNNSLLIRDAESNLALTRKILKEVGDDEEDEEEYEEEEEDDENDIEECIEEGEDQNKEEGKSLEKEDDKMFKPKVLVSVSNDESGPMTEDASESSDNNNKTVQQKTVESDESKKENLLKENEPDENNKIKETASQQMQRLQEIENKLQLFDKKSPSQTPELSGTIKTVSNTDELSYIANSQNSNEKLTELKPIVDYQVDEENASELISQINLPVQNEIKPAVQLITNETNMSDLNVLLNLRPTTIQPPNVPTFLTSTSNKEKNKINPVEKK